jgi:hypothetical protein
LKSQERPAQLASIAQVNRIRGGDRHRDQHKQNNKQKLSHGSFLSSIPRQRDS